MILFFLFVTALVAFTGGFVLACVMVVSGNADRRDRGPFLPGPYGAVRGGRVSPIRPPRAAP